MEFKGRCINFELWYTDEDSQNLEKINFTLEKLIKADIDNAIKDSCNVVVGLLLYEGFLYKNNDSFFNLLKKIYSYGTAKGIKKFILVCGIAWEYQEELDNRQLNFKIIPFDYSANAMWQSYKNYTMPAWNSQANKFLFLGGVPSRKNRILLLSKFYEQKMLTPTLAEWSFFKPHTAEDETYCKSLLSHYSDSEYQQFISLAERKIDTKYYEAKEYSSASGSQWKEKKYLNKDFFKDPNYIDIEIFQSTSISVIAEGHVFPPANDHRFLTEKTWRAVINRHPFIMADNSQRKNFAKSLGLDLFENFFNHDYDNDTNLDGVVLNVKTFLDMQHNNFKKINDKIEQNFRTFFDIINKNENILDNLKTEVSLTDDEISYWFRQKSFDHLFRIPRPNDDIC